MSTYMLERFFEELIESFEKTTSLKIAFNDAINCIENDITYEYYNSEEFVEQ